MLRTTSISLGYKEFRRDRRYVAPPVTVNFGPTSCSARNWSLGGLLLEEAPELSVGDQIVGTLQVSGRDDFFIITAEAIRSDPDTGLLACRFVDPSPEMVGALDAAVAARFSRRRRASLAGLLAAAILASMPQARAAAGALIPGSAPPLQFQLNFPNLLNEPLIPPPTSSDLQISLTSPDHDVLQFLFSPRSAVGGITNPTTGASRNYTSLNWNVFDSGGFFGSVGFAGSLAGQPGPDDLYRRNLGAPFALHGMFELGYQLGGQHSLTLSLDHSTAPDLVNDRGELLNLQLRYGLKF